MARIISFFDRRPASPVDISALAARASIEVMPRTAEKIADFRAILPAGTRVYVAHIDGTPLGDLRACVARLATEGFAPMPHVPARSYASAAELEAQLEAYAQVGATGALVLAGGRAAPAGPFDSSMALLETGFFQKHGFTRIHVAGHPEGNRDVPGGEAALLEALRWKQQWMRDHGVEGAIVTQFLFEAAPALNWARALRAAGVALPIHLGVAGPARLQTLIKFAAICGVGASMRVLTRRAADLTKLALPFTPDEIAAELQGALDREIAGLHLFPLGGIAQSADWLAQARATDAALSRAAR